MLVLSRKARQVVLIGDDVWITVLEIKRGVVKLGIEAPRDLTIWFVTSRRQLEGDLRRIMPERGAGGMWIAWPKKTSGFATDLTEDLLREVILPTGMVDRKVCAIDATWSGLLFSWRKQKT